MMSTLTLRRALLCAALSVVLSVAAIPSLHRPDPALAASQGAPARAATSVAADAITPTAALSQALTLSAPSGITTVQAPSQVRSGGRLLVTVHTTPGALVTLTITFADGSTIEKGRRANLDGIARFDPLIAYRPQSAEAATIAVTATLRRTGLADTVQAGTVTVLPRVVLTGRIVASPSAVIGRYLTVTVTSTPPNVAVRLTLSYPDQAMQRQTVYTDPATGSWSHNLRISAVHGTGDMQVSAVLSYGGLQRSLGPVTVHLRAPARR